MKFLLTSAGITNKTIAQTLLDLVGRKANEINIAFIPTAVNADPNDKSWFIDNLYQLKQQKYKKIDIIDISALPKKIWQKRLADADVLFFSGGNSTHLMRAVKESGLIKLLPRLLKTKVYAGISAGSIITAPNLSVNNPKKNIYYKKNFNYATTRGLGLVNFCFRPHLNSPTAPHSTKGFLKQISKKIPQTIYGLDDQMALKVVDKNVEPIGKGQYLVFNKKVHVE